MLPKILVGRGFDVLMKLVLFGEELPSRVISDDHAPRVNVYTFRNLATSHFNLLCPVRSEAPLG